MFTLENTSGYTQAELNAHNDKFEQYLKEKQVDLEDTNFFKHYEQKYFNDFMC